MLFFMLANVNNQLEEWYFVLTRESNSVALAIAVFRFFLRIF